MTNLHGAMFVAFDKDQIVFPYQSEIFGQLSLRKGSKEKRRKVIPMEETLNYLNDDLGL